MKKKQNNYRKKSHSISLRLDDETYKKLKLISGKNNITQSRVLRNSFNEWVKLKNILMKSDSLIIGVNFLKGLLNLANDKELIDFGKYIAKIWINEFNIHLIDMKVREDLDSMLTTLIEGIGPNEANWFSKLNFRRIDKNRILVYGLHSLLNPEKSNISDSTIKLEFKLPDEVYQN
jgi:hypothetical protein